MVGKLNGKKVAILVRDGFEQIELTDPKEKLEQEGAETFIVSPSVDKVRGWQHTEWGDEFVVDKKLENTEPDDYDALLLPGGVMNPDKLRRNTYARDFVKYFFDSGKPVAAICHAGWMLVDTGIANGKKLTSYYTIQNDMKNAGANWVDQEVVVDGNLVTSRNPRDLPAFNRETINLIAKS